MLTSLYCFSIFCAAVVDIIFLAGIEIEEPCHWVNVLHLGSFAMLFGMNIWVMFFAGMLKIRTIPRHMFGRAQSVLLPAFNSLSFSMSCLTLAAIFLQYPYHTLDSWGVEMLLQVAALATAMLLYVVNLLFLIPKNMALMNKIYLLEREAGIGEEVSMKAPFHEDLDNNEEYKRLRKEFRMWHGMAMLVGVFCVGMLCFHLYFLAGKFSIEPPVVQAVVVDGQAEDVVADA